MGADNEPQIIYKTGTIVKCLDCQCLGRLKTVFGDVVLFPDEVLTTRSMLTQKKDLQKPVTHKKLKIAEQ